MAVLNNVVVWMVSTRLPTSKSSSPFNNPLVTVPKESIMINIIVHRHVLYCFNSLVRSKYFISLSFSFSSVVSRDSKVHNFASSNLFFFFFFVDYYKVWSSGRDYVIRLYVKLPKSLCVSYSWTICRVVHIPFVRKLKFKFLTHLPLDHFAHPVMSSLILLLCKFAAFRL